MAITLTAAAAQHVATMLEKRGQSGGLRVGIKESGCQGLSYVVDYVAESTATDQVFESHGVRIIVDMNHLPQLDGTEIDFVKKNLLHDSFEFRNPQAKSSCNCGESFSV
jgi:iron-sulfur cluster assembly protein